MGTVINSLFNFTRKLWRSLSGGVLLDRIEYELFPPYTIIKKMESSILLKSRRGGALFQFPIENHVGNDDSKNESILADYIYSANPMTELYLRPFFKMKKGVFVDVGAFVGKYTLDVALQSPRNKVLAIEPNPVSFGILKNNLMLNNVEKQVMLINEAVSDCQCKVAFNLSGSVSKINAAGSSENVTTIEVNALPLFEIIERNGIKTSDIRLIKIDVEGYEHVVLKELCAKANELSEARIICEILPDDPQKESNLRQMATGGFRARKIDENNYLFFK